MHELAITQAIVEKIAEEARQHGLEARITRIVLEIGRLSGNPVQFRAATRGDGMQNWYEWLRNMTHL